MKSGEVRIGRIELILPRSIAPRSGSKQRELARSIAEHFAKGLSRRLESTSASGDVSAGDTLDSVQVHVGRGDASASRIAGAMNKAVELRSARKEN